MSDVDRETGLQGGAAEGAQGGSMRGPGGMPSKRCSIDKGQPCKGVRLGQKWQGCRGRQCS